MQDDRTPQPSEVDVSVSVVADPSVSPDDVIENVRTWLAPARWGAHPGSLPEGVLSIEYNGHKWVREPAQSETSA